MTVPTLVIPQGWYCCGHLRCNANILGQDSSGDAAAVLQLLQLSRLNSRGLLSVHAPVLQTALVNDAYLSLLSTAKGVQNCCG